MRIQRMDPTTYTINAPVTMGLVSRCRFEVLTRPGFGQYSRELKEKPGRDRDGIDG